MRRLQRSLFTLVATVLLGLATLLWTLLLPLGLDRLWAFAPPEPDSPFGQVLVIVAGATSPIVVFVVGALFAWRASRRRLFKIAGALILAFTLSWALATVLKPIIAKPRPESPFSGIITQLGFGYPSIHVAVWTTAAVLAVALASTLRKVRSGWLVLGAIAVALVAVNRLIMAAHSLTDVIGGILVGAFAASLANLLCDVHVLRPTRSGQLRAAVIFNPVKVVGTDTFRDLVENTLLEHGYASTLWLATEADDPGVAMARRALAEKVDLVLVAGGDGTVRVVLGELENSGQRVAILPSGTGNLLARNLEIPLDLEQAVLLAVDGEAKPTDLIRVELPNGVQAAAVLAGVGLDANILGNTDEGLKKAIGPAAYVVAGARHLKANPLPVRITIDEQEPVETEASLVSVGNVGELQEGVAIMPDASAHDGRLDVLVATPHTALGMAQMVTELLFEAGEGTNIARYTGKRLRLEVPGGAACQIDGDVVGEVTEVTFEVLPGAVQLVQP